jgi:hypothetical protein
MSILDEIVVIAFATTALFRAEATVRINLPRFFNYRPGIATRTKPIFRRENVAVRRYDHWYTDYYPSKRFPRKISRAELHEFACERHNAPKISIYESP